MVIEYPVGELFCGAGGLSLGAKYAKAIDTNGTTCRLRLAWANDIDQNACLTYQNNITPADKNKVICCPVQELNFKGLAKIEGLLFGFPCNDFSIVGEKRGFKGDYGPLYTYGVKAISVHHPKFFLAENVSGLSSANQGKAFEKILKDLSNAGSGYRITSHLYKFEEYGVPQTRHRIIIVGIRSDLGKKFFVPAPTTPNKYISCSEALLGADKILYNNEKTKHSRNTIERLKYIPAGGNAWHADIPKELQLNVRNCRLSHIYRRLHPDQPSYTLTGSGGGGTHVYHWNENRALTNRERARLQTFPDDFIFYGPKESVRAQIGHAVPPLAAQIVLEAIMKCLNGLSYEYIQSSHEDVPPGASMSSFAS